MEKSVTDKQVMEITLDEFLNLPDPDKCNYFGHLREQLLIERSKTDTLRDHVQKKTTECENLMLKAPSKEQTSEAPTSSKLSQKRRQSELIERPKTGELRDRVQKKTTQCEKLMLKAPGKEQTPEVPTSSKQSQKRRQSEHGMTTRMEKLAMDKKSKLSEKIEQIELSVLTNSAGLLSAAYSVIKLKIELDKFTKIGDKYQLKEGPLELVQDPEWPQACLLRPKTNTGP